MGLPIPDTVLKAILLAMLVFIAWKWSSGGFKKPMAQLKKFKHKYGLVTVMLIVLWWIITPSFGMPDDIITVYLLAKFGFVPYLIAVGLLTAYIIYRLKVTIVIYEK